MELKRHRQVAGADGRALCIIMMPMSTLRAAAAARMSGRRGASVMGRVGHVEPENVDSGVDEAAEHLR